MCGCFSLRHRSYEFCVETIQRAVVPTNTVGKTANDARKCYVQMSYSQTDTGFCTAVSCYILASICTAIDLSGWCSTKCSSTDKYMCACVCVHRIEHLPLSGAVAARPGSVGGSRLSKRLLTLFLSSMSSLRRYFTWLDSKGRGWPFTVVRWREGIRVSKANKSLILIWGMSLSKVKCFSISA